MLTKLQRYMPRIPNRAARDARLIKAVCFLTAAALVLALSPLSGALASGIPTLKPGMSGESVKTLQASLVKRGYLPSADGKYGPATAAAVKLFQQQAGLKQDGVAGANTQKLLNGLTGSAKTNVTLKLGDKSGEVKLLQGRLKSLGYLNVSAATDYYGTKTKASVAQFQKKAGLAADGAAGPKTLIRLYSSDAPKSQTASSPSSPDEETLRFGMSGSAVKAMQTALVKRGYLKLADGKFGSGTKEAVRLFQRNAGLPSDGVAGEKTLGALNRLQGSGKTNTTLKSGSKNAEVTILQQRLISLGYLRNAKADGSYGTTTKAAVVKFQQKVGLTADGAAGPKTLVRLYSSTAPKYMTKGERVVAYAKQYLGVKYVYGAESPSAGFDCSGLVYYVYKHYFGITLPRSAHGLTAAGRAVKLADARPGDILCFGSSVASVGHVGIYIGNNQYIEAPQTGEVVKITNLKRAVATVRRIFADE